MMVAAAWGMDGGTHLWAGNADRPADPTGRYEVIKIFRVNVDHYKFYKEVFDKLPVELMRWVFENRISNEELPWLANYTLNFKKADGSVPNESERLGPTPIPTRTRKVAWPASPRCFTECPVMRRRSSTR